jgi:uncharacterized protein YndB with AHSA1/START domain
VAPFDPVLLDRARAFDRAHARAPVSVALEVDLPVPPERAWATLVRVERWPLWHPGVEVAVLRADVPAPGVRLDWRADGMRIRSVVLQADSPRRLEWSLRMLGGRGAQRWTLTPSPGGVTAVRLEEWWTGVAPVLLRRTLQRTLVVARTVWLERLRDHGVRQPLPRDAERGDPSPGGGSPGDPRAADHSPGDRDPGERFAGDADSSSDP